MTVVGVILLTLSAPPLGAIVFVSIWRDEGLGRRIINLFCRGSLWASLRHE